jgi:hypothetical protein
MGRDSPVEALVTRASDYVPGEALLDGQARR